MAKRGKSFWMTLICAALLAFAGLPASAQTFRGTILGTVTDASGAAVAQAKVTVRSPDTGLVRETVTSDDGSYVVPELPLGPYTVTVEKTGFQSFVTKDVHVDVAQERRVDAVLKPGAVTQTIEVSGETLPQVETTTNVLGGIMTPKQIETLPVNGRDYQKLIFMEPGIAGSPDMITDSPGSFGVFSMNGARGRSNNFLLDGTDMNDGFRNDPAINEAGVFADPATLLPVDAIAELHVISNYMPEFGRNAGAIINIVTKSGANTFHGAGLEYFRNNWFDARNYFNFLGTPQDSFRNNQFGGSLGGPIIKDKTFFYVNYEGQREGGGLSLLACVPSANSFAAATANIGGPQNINPVIAALLANPKEVWPAPNLPTTSDDTGCAPNSAFGPNNVSTSNKFFNRVDSGIIKLDHHLNKDNLLSGRYYLGDSDQGFPLGLVGSGFIPGFNVITPTRVQLVSISWTDVLSPNVVNEVRLGWNRFAEGFFPQDRSFNPASIGLNTGVVPFDFGLPAVSVSGSSGGFATIGSTKSVPRQRVDTNWQFIDDFGWKKGRHDFKFGFEWRKTSISQTLDFNFRGTLSFPTLEAFLTGAPSGGSVFRGSTNRNTYQNNYGFYAQDSFRWTPRLTVNYGLRWDYYGVLEEKHGLFFNFLPSTGQLLQEGAPGLPRLYEPDYKDFAPRLSVAYDLTGRGKTIIRAGWGLFFDAFSQDAFIDSGFYNSSFDPGAAYAGIGPGNTAIVSGSVISPIVQNQTVYGSFAPLGDAFGVDRNLHTQYMQNFNLNVEQAIGSHAGLQVGYVGSQGRRLLRFRDINKPSQAVIDAHDLACNCISSVPRNVPQFFYINFEESSSASNYNALQASLRITSWHGLTSQLNYVWSHSIDNASDVFDFEPQEAQPNDSTNANGERGNSSFDLRHRFAWNFTYEFPKWTNAVPKLTAGWGIAGDLTVQTGQPFHLNYNFSGDYSGSGEFFDRPDVVGPIHYNYSDPTHFLDLTSFAVPCMANGSGATSEQICVPGSRHFGNLGRNSLRAAPFRQFNFSLFKDTSLTERLKMQFRVDAFNLFNHPTFSNPFLPAFFASANAAGIDPATGRSLGFYALTATADVGEGNPFLGGGGPRSLQFGVRFTF